MRWSFRGLYRFLRSDRVTGFEDRATGGGRFGTVGVVLIQGRRGIVVILLVVFLEALYKILFYYQNSLSALSTTSSRRNDTTIQSLYSNSLYIRIPYNLLLDDDRMNTSSRLIEYNLLREEFDEFSRRLLRLQIRVAYTEKESKRRQREDEEGSAHLR